MTQRRRRTSLGTNFAHAFAAKDGVRIRELVHPEIDFRGLTQNRNWEASDPESLVSILFENWLEDEDQVEGLESVESRLVGRPRAGGLPAHRVLPQDGRHLVEQQAYIGEQGRQDRLDACGVLGLPPYLIPLRVSTTRNRSPWR